MQTTSFAFSVGRGFWGGRAALLLTAPHSVCMEILISLSVARFARKCAILRLDTQFYRYEYTQMSYFHTRWAYDPFRAVSVRRREKAGSIRTRPRSRLP